MRTKNGLVFRPIVALAIFLARLATPAPLSSLIEIFGYSLPALSRCIDSVSSIIYKKWHHLLEFDPVRLPPKTLDEFATAFALKGCPSDRIWGAIDCTIISICRPRKKQRTTYSGYKKSHALKYQGVTTPDGIIALCFGPVEGRSADGTLLRLSGLKTQLAKYARGVDGTPRLIYGDPAYTPYNGRYIMAGWKKVRELTPMEKRFNKEMSRYRQCVEWSFGKVIYPCLVPVEMLTLAR